MIKVTFVPVALQDEVKNVVILSEKPFLSKTISALSVYYQSLSQAVVTQVIEGNKDSALVYEESRN